MSSAFGVYCSRRKSQKFASLHWRGHASNYQQQREGPESSALNNGHSAMSMGLNANKRLMCLPLHPPIKTTFKNMLMLSVARMRDDLHCNQTKQCRDIGFKLKSASEQGLIGPSGINLQSTSDRLAFRWSRCWQKSFMEWWTCRVMNSVLLQSESVWWCFSPMLFWGKLFARKNWIERWQQNNNNYCWYQSQGQKQVNELTKGLLGKKISVDVVNNCTTDTNPLVEQGIWEGISHLRSSSILLLDTLAAAGWAFNFWKIISTICGYDGCCIVH